jgi:glycosyltransferase involved in cell wall biosynthesis
MTAAERRWIVVAEESLLPPTDGARVETLNFLGESITAGVVCALLITTSEPVDPAAIRERIGDPQLPILITPRRTGWQAQLSRRPYTVTSRPFPPEALAKALAQFSGLRPTAVVSYTQRVAHVGSAIAGSLGVPHVVRPHNLESVYFLQLAAGSSGPHKLAYRLEAWKTIRYERQLETDRSVAALLDISWDDHLVRERRADIRCEYLPPFHAPSTGRPDAAQEQVPPADVVFVGSLDSVQNVDGITWFLGECWPLLRRTHPDVSMRIVGRKPTPGLRALIEAAPGVTLLADVPAVRPYLDSSKVVVNPMRLGSGVNIKMVDALSYSAAVVSTTHGCRGLRLVPGSQVVVADDPAGFAAAVGDLLDDDDRRQEVAAEGSRWAREEFDAAGQLDLITRALAGEPRQTVEMSLGADG